jgi:hypothetical protein
MFRHASPLHPPQNAAPSNEGIQLQVLVQINATVALAIAWHSDSSQ